MVKTARKPLASFPKKHTYSGVYLLLNFQSCRHIGHCCCGWEWSHLTMQWIWKQCEQAPHTSGQSSPGSLQSGQQLSNGIRQMPQLSSFATQRQVATPVQPTHDINKPGKTGKYPTECSFGRLLTFNGHFHVVAPALRCCI